MFEYFYHEILRKTVIAFGTLFNGMTIKHTDSSDDVVSEIKVPLAYGPMQKFLARLEQSPDLNKPVQISLPRMSFEFIGLNYDPSRKVTTTQTFITANTANKSQEKKVYMPVPYNMQFELNILTKLNDDMLQIVEQILPYFQPSFNLSVNLISEIGEKRDIPIVLDSITMNDDYEGDFTTRRALIYTLRFTAKTYLFGPVSSATKDIIRTARVSYITGTDVTNTTRELAYVATPRALKNYTGTVVTTLTSDISITDTVVEVESSSGLTTKTYIDLEGEELFIKSISGNKLTVERGQDGTTVTTHLRGAPVKTITSSDNALVEDGDDFGFSGTIS